MHADDEELPDEAGMLASKLYNLSDMQGKIVGAIAEPDFHGRRWAPKVRSIAERGVRNFFPSNVYVRNLTVSNQIIQDLSGRQVCVRLVRIGYLFEQEKRAAFAGYDQPHFYTGLIRAAEMHRRNWRVIWEMMIRPFFIALIIVGVLIMIARAVMLPPTP